VVPLNTFSRSSRNTDAKFFGPAPAMVGAKPCRRRKDRHGYRIRLRVVMESLRIVTTRTAYTDTPTEINSAWGEAIDRDQIKQRPCGWAGLTSGKISPAPGRFRPSFGSRPWTFLVLVTAGRTTADGEMKPFKARGNIYSTSCGCVCVTVEDLYIGGRPRWQLRVRWVSKHKQGKWYTLARGVGNGIGGRDYRPLSEGSHVHAWRG